MTDYKISRSVIIKEPGIFKRQKAFNAVNQSFGSDCLHELLFDVGFKIQISVANREV